MKEYYKTMFDRCDIEREEEWRKWCEDMPYLHFDSEWEVKVIPPFGGALARFVVKKGNKSVSVYFDTACRLGWYAGKDGNPMPYFEIYPYADDVRRYSVCQTKQMMADIRKVLNGEDKPDEDES